MNRISRINWIFALVCLGYSALMLLIGWWAIASTGFESAFVSSAVAATFAGAVAAFGFWKQNPWVLGGGATGVMLFCPSPLGVAPMFVGFVLIVLFGFFYVRKVDDTGEKGWSRNEA